ncbi:hypothetical protein [Streptosporangium roseum]|uniref:hypothetical protein n=1 Tax=Streptosporangium roseum TaxID=2001 RepID=UPI00332DEEF6
MDTLVSASSTNMPISARPIRSRPTSPIPAARKALAMSSGRRASCQVTAAWTPTTISAPREISAAGT